MSKVSNPLSHTTIISIFTLKKKSTIVLTYPDPLWNVPHLLKVMSMWVLTIFTVIRNASLTKWHLIMQQNLSESVNPRMLGKWRPCRLFCQHHASDDGLTEQVQDLIWTCYIIVGGGVNQLYCLSSNWPILI